MERNTKNGFKKLSFYIHDRLCELVYSSIVRAGIGRDLKETIPPFLEVHSDRHLVHFGPVRTVSPSPKQVNCFT
jgi:hypothetical protein